MRSDPERFTAAVDGVLITDEVLRRTTVGRETHREDEPVLPFVQLLAEDADLALSRLLQHALDRCLAGSAGLCAIETDGNGGDVFRWVAVAGPLTTYVGSAKPRHASPCGICVDGGSPQAFLRPARQFAYLAPLGLAEVVVVPVRREGIIVATLWIASHDSERHFSREDVRLLEWLAPYTAVAMRMQQLKADAAAATDARDSLLLRVAHELRQPVHTILGWVDMLQQGALDPSRLQAAYAAIEQGAQAQAQLVSDLLDLAQLATGALRVTAAPMDVCALVRSLVDQLMPISRTRNVVVGFEVEEPVRLVVADQQRVRQIVSNLVLNAIKFTPDHGKVTVGVRDIGEHVEIAVQDTGVGVESDFLETMFDPFRQSDNRVHGREHGVGIGLTIVKELVKACGGSIHAHSDGVGKGTTITVLFPVAPNPPLSGGPAPSC
jgi:signal transduction histidine kinase